MANIWRASMEELGRSDRAFEGCFTVGAGSVASQGAREHALLAAHEGIARAVAVVSLTRWEPLACVRLGAIACRNPTALCSWSATKSDELTHRVRLVKRSRLRAHWRLSAGMRNRRTSLAKRPQPYARCRTKGIRMPSRYSSTDQQGRNRPRLLASTALVPPRNGPHCPASGDQLLYCGSS